MFLNLVAFDFQSQDVEAEERHYYADHVPLARRFPDLRIYYSGRLVRTAGKDPDRFRGVILGYDSSEAASASMRSDVIAPIMDDTRAHLKDLLSISADGAAIVNTPAPGPGSRRFVMAAEFNLADADRDLPAAEQHYLGVHVAIARELPGLRHYVIGKIAGGAPNDRYRMAMLAFDSHDALRAAYDSPAGRELLRDERATIRDARVWRIDARSEL